MVEGTSLQTVESQTQLDQLYSGLPNRVEEAKKQRGVRAIFEVMASLAVADDGTPSMIDEEHVSKQIKVEHGEDGFPIGSPDRIDAVAQSNGGRPNGSP